MSSKPLLGYWDIRGLAQPIRYLLTYAGVEFEEKLYTKPEDWFGEKFTLGFDFPNLPYYIDGDVKLTQSLAIMRYIARKYNLDGANEQEKNDISLMEQQINDMNRAIVQVTYDPNCAKLKEDYIKALPDSLKLVDNFMRDRAFVAGTNVSYVDFWTFEFLLKIRTLVPEVFNKFPGLGKYVERVESLRAIAAYNKNRTPKTFNAAFAGWNATL